MTVDWLHFTPLSALVGGGIIGSAVALLLLLNGRVAGISGITGGLLTPQGKEKGWRAAFLVGLLISPWLYRIARPLPDMPVNGSSLWLIAAGILVGLGTRLGGGCTSGHGVCGVARLSPRSLLATAVFMLLGFITVWALRQWEEFNVMYRSVFALLSGAIFGLGLIVAGMANPAKVLAFLDVTGHWDPSLALVMVGAIAVAAPAFFWFASDHVPCWVKQYNSHLPRRIDRRLLAGSTLFGIGWGMAGICPGPAWVLAGAGSSAGWQFVAAMLAGMALYEVILFWRK